jgi:hypothetical protein
LAVTFRPTNCRLYLKALKSLPREKKNADLEGRLRKTKKVALGTAHQLGLSIEMIILIEISINKNRENGCSSSVSLVRATKIEPLVLSLRV